MTNSYIKTQDGKTLIENMTDEDIDWHLSEGDPKTKAWLLRELVMQLQDHVRLVDEMKDLGSRC